MALLFCKEGRVTKELCSCLFGSMLNTDHFTLQKAEVFYMQKEKKEKKKKGETTEQTFQVWYFRLPTHSQWPKQKRVRKQLEVLKGTWSNHLSSASSVSVWVGRQGLSQLPLPFCGGFAQRCLLPHAFTEMWQSMKALLLELDENGLGFVCFFF